MHKALPLLLLTACTTMYPPSPMTHDQDPGPMEESSVTYEPAISKEKIPRHEDKHRFTNVRIRSTVNNSSMIETYNHEFDGVRVTAWTFDGDRAPEVQIGQERIDEGDGVVWEARVLFGRVGGNKTLTAYFGMQFMEESDALEYLMETNKWYPAATGGNFVVQDPTKRGGFVLQSTYFFSRQPGQRVRVSSWAYAVRTGLIECQKQSADGEWTPMRPDDCKSYKPDVLVFFHTLGKWT